MRKRIGERGTVSQGYGKEEAGRSERDEGNWPSEFEQRAQFPQKLSPSTPAKVMGTPEIWTKVLDRK